MFVLPALILGFQSIPDALERLAAADRVVLTVGTRVAIVAAPLCADRAANVGLELHDLAQYAPGVQSTAARLFTLGADPGIAAVAADGPAERAGLRVGDALIAVNGTMPDLPPGLGRIAALTDLIARESARGTVILTIRRAGEDSRHAVVPVPACPARFQVADTAALNAHADGIRVEVTTALVALARNEDELAAILAHELAHNILHHRAWLTNHPSRAAARRAELAADRLSVRLMVLAGYDPAAALSVWRRMPAKGAGRAHPATADRLRTLEAAIAAGRTSETP